MTCSAATLVVLSRGGLSHPLTDVRPADPGQRRVAPGADLNRQEADAVGPRRDAELVGARVAVGDHGVARRKLRGLGGDLGGDRRDAVAEDGQPDILGDDIDKPAMAGRIIRLLAQTGMRMDEVCSLEWSQVSIPRREIRLTKTKTSSPRVVPLSDDALGTILGTPRHITSNSYSGAAMGERHTNLFGAFRKIVSTHRGAPD